MYRSTAVIKAQEATGMGIGSLIASKLGALGGLANFATSMGEIPENSYVAILKSRWMSEQIVGAFDLRKVYKMDKAPLEKVIKALGKHTNFQLDDLTMNIIIYVEDQSPKRAKEIADYYVNQLDKRNQELKSSRASMERQFIGQRLEDEQRKLSSIEDSIYHYQMETGVLDIKEQVKATISAISAIQAERLATQAELEMKERIFGPSHAESNYLRMKLASIDSTIQTLIRNRTNGDGEDFLLHLRDTPQQGMQYLRLIRDIEIQQLLVGYLLQQYEQAKIDELRNTPTLLRIDPPVQAELRIWPRRGLMVIIAAFGSLILGIVIAMLMEFFAKASQNTEHPQHEKIMEIRRSLSR
jgi:tyrosine-protein kinase Etk/Wzc